MIASERYCISCGAANARGASLCFACGRSLKITTPLTFSAPSTALLLGRYRILSQVGKGGFSAVYRAEDAQSGNRLVAIKAITLSGLKPHEVIEATEAFNRETQLLAGLKHPNLPCVYNHFADRECWYLVMNFIEGKTLEKHLEAMHAGRMPVGEVFELGLLLCSLLEYLHTRQPPIIFRDLKPTNVMLTPDGRITLIDFGIARRFKPGQARDTMPFGSPGYAAPEQYGKAQTTPRTDIYSLGVILHQLLTGNDPTQTPFRFAPLHLQDQPALEGLEALILQMLELDPARRPASVVMVKNELLRISNAWSRQHLYGLQVQLSAGQQQPLSWQAALPGSQSGPAAGSSSGQVQVSAGQQLAPRVSGMYGPTGGQNPSRQRNKWAVASLTLAFVSIFLPLLTCITATLPYGYSLSGTHFGYFSLALLMLIPAVLAIIFGHIGLRKAQTVPAMSASGDVALTGMVIGYIFGSIYLGFLCMLMAFLFIR